MRRPLVPLLLLALTASPPMPIAAEIQEGDVFALVKRAEASGRIGSARKTKTVDARPARPGEIVVTLIAGEGKETSSPPAHAGDWVVRNRCPETGNEEILVKAAKFAERYESPEGPADAAGWQPVRPRGVTMRFLVVPEDAGVFRFAAPWGEMMIARPGDAIVQDPSNPKDTYRIAAAAFRCTYEIIEPAGD